MQQKDDGWNPLSVAAQKGNEAVVRLLLENEGIDVNESKDDRWNPLLIATENGHTDVVKILIEEGKAKINKARKPDGVTPLHFAALLGKTRSCKFFIRTSGNKCKSS